MTAFFAAMLALLFALDAYRTFARTKPVVGSRLSREWVQRNRGERECQTK